MCMVAVISVYDFSLKSYTLIMVLELYRPNLNQIQVGVNVVIMVALN